MPAICEGEHLVFMACVLQMTGHQDQVLLQKEAMFFPLSSIEVHLISTYNFRLGFLTSHVNN